MAPKHVKRVLLDDEAIPQFISEVKKRECIWNPEHEKYNDRYATTVAWKEIATIMDTPEDLLKAKWKNLRDLFKREIKKLKKISTSDENYRGRWRYFSQMWFMRKHRPTDMDFWDQLEDEGEGEESPCNEEEDPHEENEDNPLSTFVKCEPKDSSDNQEQENLEELYVELDPVACPAPPKRRKKEVTKEEEGDYDMMFLKSLTPFMKQLDPMRKLIVRSKIQDILINELAIAQQGSRNNNKMNNNS